MEEEPRHIAFEIKTLNQMIRKAIMNLSIKSGMEQMTVMHARILRYLYKNRERDVFQKDLEAEFQINSSTVTSILKLMEKKGYIRRVSVEWDARLKKLVLTETAGEMQSKCFQDFIRIQGILEKEITQGIPAEELEIFQRVLSKMKDNLGRRGSEDGDAPPPCCCGNPADIQLKMREE